MAQHDTGVAAVVAKPCNAIKRADKELAKLRVAAAQPK